MLPLTLGILLVIAAPIYTHKILLFPMDHQAHVNSFSIIGAELQSRGHTVDIIVADRSKHLATQRGITTLVRSYQNVLDHSIFEHASTGGMSAQRDYIKTLYKTALEQTTYNCNDKDFIAQLKNANYDLMLVEGSDLGRVQLLLPYKLDIPFLTISIRHAPWQVRIPSLPSVEGLQGIKLLDENSTLFDRLLNTLAWLVVENFIAPPSFMSKVNDTLFDELVPERENIGFMALLRKAEIFLTLLDIYCTDVHRISAPHYQFIGALGGKDPDPLPNELKEFMDSAKHGVIVLSFGSGMKRIRKESLDPMLEAFKELKQNVIMRHDGDLPEYVPSNVLIQKWLPQNDLLAHPNTKLFITHCGSNGQTEAVYHGVPMLMLPGMIDQFYNARRAETKGYGLVVDTRTFQLDEFKQKLNEMLMNPVYFETTKKCSRILHSLLSPQNTAAFWIEHVLHHGSDHLKPYYLDMPWYKFWMLDIIAFVCVVCILMALLVKWCCVKLCCRSAQAKSKRD